MHYSKLSADCFLALLTACLCAAPAYAAGGKQTVASCLESGKQAFAAKSYLQAQDTFTRCLKLDPDNVDAHLSLAGVLLTQDDLDGAEKHFNAALRNMTRTSPYFSYTYSMLGDIALKRQQNDTALKMYTKSLEYNAANVNSLVGKGVIVEYQGDKQGAAEYYQKLAIRQRRENLDFREEVQKLKEMYKETPSLIGDKVSELKAMRKSAIRDELCWLDKADGSGFDDYIHDMALIQKYAALNRLAMVREIAEKMGWRLGRKIETIHNYIDTENMILRKGAVSAAKDELLVIPMNMRDGILVCKGKGNPDWNCSAPHGAGRIMSRRAAREKLNMDEFKESMRGIYTTSVNTETIDECPMAYKPAESIKQAIAETVEIPQNDFFVGVQFHPEFKSRPNKAHPLFRELVKTALAQKNK